VGVVFTTGSISAPGVVEGLEHGLRADHPLRALYLAHPPGSPGPQPSINLALHHGVRSCLEYHRSGDILKARQLANPDLAPHVSFVDMAGHGYAVAHVSAEAFECEFVCIPRPLERSEHADGGPLLYRVRHRARLWARGQRPTLEQTVLDGNPALSL